MTPPPDSVTLTVAQPPAAAAERALATVAVVGLGYVGLPTGLALAEAGFPVVGVDASERRLEDIRSGSADLLARDRERLESALARPGFTLTTDAAAIAAADAVLVCVPTPVDELRRPDLRFVRSACATAVAHARPGQTIVLTSTTSVGSTRELLVAPLAERGLVPGENVHVAFSPERIDPGNAHHAQETVPRIVGGLTPACTEAAASVLREIAAELHLVSSPEAAELAKLYENTFRAVNIAFANEMEEASRAFGVDPAEVLDAAATKPYGFMRFAPGVGVGGHCIPCDPHYLLAGLSEQGVHAPVTERAMDAIAARPGQVVDRAIRLLGRPPAGARVLVVGAAYKPGVRDVRESPAVEILRLMHALGAEVSYHDPLVPSIELPSERGQTPFSPFSPSERGLTPLSLFSVPAGCDFDLAIVCTRHPGHDYSWVDGIPVVA